MDAGQSSPFLPLSSILHSPSSLIFSLYPPSSIESPAAPSPTLRLHPRRSSHWKALSSQRSMRPLIRPPNVAGRPQSPARPAASGKATRSTCLVELVKSYVLDVRRWIPVVAVSASLSRGILLPLVFSVEHLILYLTAGGDCVDLGRRRYSNV